MLITSKLAWKNATTRIRTKKRVVQEEKVKDRTLVESRVKVQDRTRRGGDGADETRLKGGTREVLR